MSNLHPTKERFEAWLFSQPRERSYPYMSNEDCLICQFFKANTKLTVSVGGDAFTVWPSGEAYKGAGTRMEMEPWLRSLAISFDFVCGRTFGHVQDAWRRLFPETEPEQSASNPNAGVVQPYAKGRWT